MKIFLYLYLTALCSIHAASTEASTPAGQATLSKRSFTLDEYPSAEKAGEASSLLIRGGACNEAGAALFGKVGTSAAFQAAGLMGVLALGKAADPILVDLLGKEVKIFGTSPALWAAFLTVIFASSSVGTLVDGGSSAALNQVLDIDEVPGNGRWFAELKKPRWNPPGWLFPIMWLLISKPTQLLAVNRLWSVTEDNADRAWRLLAYCLHLALGDAWNKVFFGYQCIGRGAAVITAFFSILVFTAILFWKVDPLAGKFMLPTCGWVTVATALNWSIYYLNRPVAK